MLLDAAQGEEQISREDAAGLLVWADTPIVIEPLIAAAGYPSMPNVPAIVIPSLQKFYRKHEHAREAILEIAQKTGTLRNAIATLDKEGVTIPGRSFKPIFASKSILNIWPALEYIRRTARATTSRRWNHWSITISARRSASLRRRWSRT